MKLRRPPGRRRGGILRPICALIGHDWSDWHTGGYLIAEYFEGWQNRICWRCDRDDYRPEPDTAHAVHGAA